ncbi:MAG TPA: gfo/Idh/MocA family oxidoreductase [Gammaproteobacteria bacterium]|nr:Gfo/Idh/MocA family oxidoreductase [Arenicellales bacterium]MDP6551530.1 Gfo/Idh/MocA family oxidoreductase [Arenicellales bacterium]MDP6790956.1 Gfo/Idh/MocA family oxidoreductase [Arenicellales bacterium]MDP6918502.1 Gfo/Idh/MocA family oxidoreductase [Arenicellales bacterium]HCX87593.1 gfo/Idh/MocA family oxidoreductase [Gammaproteobacteria bacterium]
MTEQKLKVGVVGVGYLGSIHAQIYQRMPDVTLSGVMDTDVEAGERIASECGCTFIRDVEQMLDSVDAVSVVVPTSVHREIAEPFLEKRIPVLLEKPVAHTLGDAQAIVDLARQTGTLLQIGHLERFNAGVVRLAAELDRPRFIEVHRLGEFVDRATDVDVVTDLMIHDIDIVLSLVPSELRYVSAVGARVVTDHVDIANARLEFDNGAIVNVTASRISSRRVRRIRIFAESCYLALNFEDQQIDVARPGPRPQEGGFAPIVTESLQVTPRAPLDAELADFADCVRTGRDPVVGGEAGVRALQVAHEVRQRIDDSLHTL